MADYRTITVSGVVSSNIVVPAQLTTAGPGVTAVATASLNQVAASADVFNSAIDAAALISDMVVDVTARVTSGAPAVDYPIYTGAYEVTPEWYAQTLETAQKVMTNDVTVRSIQLEEVSNIGGGKTVYIGGII